MQRYIYIREDGGVLLLLLLLCLGIILDYTSYASNNMFF